MTQIDDLRWRTRGIGCLLPMLAGAVAVFGVAAFNPEQVADLADQRRGEVFRLTMAMTWHGVNVPVALVALYVAFETFRFGWRWADEVAVSATDSGFVPHRSTFLRAISWIDIEDVCFVQLGRAPSLLVRLRGGGSRTIRGIDNEDGAAERFAAAARERAIAHRGAATSAPGSSL